MIDDLENHVQLQILMAFKSAAENENHHFLKSKGLSKRTIENLRNLPVSALVRIAKLHPFELSCPESLLNTRMESGIKKDREQRLIRKAIKLGVSRQSLQSFVTINSKEFSNIRNSVGFSKKREKPTKLDDTLLLEINKTHANIKKQEAKLGENYSSLEILIKLAESHNIDINQLYTYYYTYNADLFNEERSLR